MPNNVNRSQQTYWITGATGGMGRRLSEQLLQTHRDGVNLIVSGRHQDPLDELCQHLQSKYPHGSFFSVPFDVTSFTQWDMAAQQIQEHVNHVDGWAHLVGSILLKPVHATRPEEWEETLALNLTSAFFGLRILTRWMSRNPGGGNIVLMSSAAGQYGLPNHEAISAAKAGIDGLVRSAAATYAAKGICINAIAPGLVETPLAQPFLKTEAARTASEAIHPLHRLGTPDDLAPVIQWLLSPQTRWVTGQTIGIDGGLSQVQSTPASSGQKVRHRSSSHRVSSTSSS